jgi:hypothetical protein
LLLLSVLQHAFVVAPRWGEKSLAYLLRYFRLTTLCQGANMAGYSGTPLGKKLGIKPGSRVYLHGMPPSVRKELAGDLAAAQVLKSLGAEVDFIHAFVSSQKELSKLLAGWKKALAKSGMLWISWPKKTSKIESDLTGDLVRESGLEAGLVDIKVCAVDEDWSGHKFVYRKTVR